MIVVCLLVFVFNNCINEQKKSADFRGEEYIGSAKCAECHKEVYESYIKTAHNLSSLAATRKSIKGSFAADTNIVHYRPTLKVAMEQRDSSFYQVAYIDEVARQAARFDVVVGSGRKGQSYLYWYDNNVFQLPVSYFVPGSSWVNSPGFPPKNVNFNRNIPVGCFECHSSYIKKTETKPVGENLYDFFDKNRIIWGIDCERCHGPATKHVRFHENSPEEKQAKFIATSSSLNRSEKLTMCAVCHSGTRETVGSPFFYKPGEKLSKYLSTDTSTLSTKDIDVHGKQYQLLSASQCFLKSKTMTCSSCHNTHIQEKDNMINFSKKCMSCHTNPTHNFSNISASSGEALQKNCVDCHMPTKPSALITMTSQAQSNPIPALVRTHYISIYPDATKKFLSRLK